MDFAYSKHALEQMQLRGISKSDVNKILSSPLNVLNDGMDKIYHGVVYTNDKKYLIRIFVNQSKQPPLIKTVYKTSKLDKYHEG